LSISYGKINPKEPTCGQTTGETRTSYKCCSNADKIIKKEKKKNGY